MGGLRRGVCVGGQSMEGELEVMQLNETGGGRGWGGGGQGYRGFGDCVAL